MANVINLDKLFDQTTPIQLRVNKTSIQIGREKEEFTLSLAQWLRMNGVQKYETNLEKDGIHYLADLYKNQASISEVKFFYTRTKTMKNLQNILI